jgi:hypothetical protein
LCLDWILIVGRRQLEQVVRAETSLFEVADRVLLITGDPERRIQAADASPSENPDQSRSSVIAVAPSPRRRTAGSSKSPFAIR